MNKRLLAAAALAAAALAATAAPVGAATPATSSVSTAPAAASVSPVHVVRSGERVDAGAGWTVWLTREGKHWTDPDGLENFRSVVDGNVDLSRPGVSHQSESTPSHTFHSGLYYGTRNVGKVVLSDKEGHKTSASLLELPGRPGWGVWYAHRDAAGDGVGVTLYDREGRLLAELPAF